MTWVEIGETSLIQAQMLLKEFPESDGSLAIVKALYDIVQALFGKKGGKDGSSPRKPVDEVMTAAVVIPELEEVLKRSGWTPPTA